MLIQQILVRFFWTGTVSVIQIFHRAGAAVYEIKGLCSAIAVYSDAQYTSRIPFRLFRTKSEPGKEYHFDRYGLSLGFRSTRILTQIK